MEKDKLETQESTSESRMADLEKKITILLYIVVAMAVIGAVCLF